MAVRALVLSLWLVIMLAETARAINCYECDSVNDPGCGDGDKFQPDDLAKTNCDALEVPEDLRAIFLQRPDTACQTKYYKGLTGQPHFIRRSCYFGDLSMTEFQCDEEPDPVVPYLKFLACSLCKDDLCNAARATKSVYSWGVYVGLILLTQHICNIFQFI